MFRRALQKPYKLIFMALFICHFNALGNTECLAVIADPDLETQAFLIWKEAATKAQEFRKKAANLPEIEQQSKLQIHEVFEGTKHLVDQLLHRLYETRANHIVSTTTSGEASEKLQRQVALALRRNQDLRKKAQLYFRFFKFALGKNKKLELAKAVASGRRLMTLQKKVEIAQDLDNEIKLSTPSLNRRVEEQEALKKSVWADTDASFESAVNDAVKDRVRELNQLASNSEAQAGQEIRVLVRSWIQNNVELYGALLKQASALTTYACSGSSECAANLSQTSNVIEELNSSMDVENLIFEGTVASLGQKAALMVEQIFGEVQRK